MILPKVQTKNAVPKINKPENGSRIPNWHPLDNQTTLNDLITGFSIVFYYKFKLYHKLTFSLSYFLAFNLFDINLTDIQISVHSALHLCQKTLCIKNVTLSMTKKLNSWSSLLKTLLTIHYWNFAAILRDNGYSLFFSMIDFFYIKTKRANFIKPHRQNYAKIFMAFSMFHFLKALTPNFSHYAKKWWRYQYSI